MVKNEYRWLTDTYVAHRGLFDNVDTPENSIPAFEKAAEMGFGMLVIGIIIGVKIIRKI